MSKLILDNVSAGFAATTLINANNDKVEIAVENTLSRDGTGPNQMLANLDMNGNFILNQANPITVEGFNWLGPWVTATYYHVGDVIQINNSSYIAIVDHTAGVFATDLAAMKWQIVASSAALPSQSGNTGKILTTDGSNASWGSVGTLALPIGGGTLTGPLNGTTGHFTGATTLDGTVTAGGDVNIAGSIATTTNLFIGGVTSLVGSLTMSDIITPDPIKGIKGTTTINSAQAGSVGEEIRADVPVGSAVSLVTSTAKNIVSISLTPGDWDINGLINFRTTTTTHIFSLFMTSSLVSNTVDSYQTSYRANDFVPGSATDIGFPIPYRRLIISTTTTIYLVATAGFSTSTLTGWGFISARRVR